MPGAAAEVARFRSFYRLVSERSGALDEEYLDGGRPLGASRLPWGAATAPMSGNSARRLGLESGYLSRLLRRREPEGLVEVGASPSDRRVRVSHSPRAAERSALASMAAATIWLPLSAARLPDRQGTGLVDATGEVGRLLTASAVGRREVDPEDPAGHG
jgi:hypothetical protein